MSEGNGNRAVYAALAAFRDRFGRDPVAVAVNVGLVDETAAAVIRAGRGWDLARGVTRNESFVTFSDEEIVTPDVTNVTPELNYWRWGDDGA